MFRLTFLGTSSGVPTKDRHVSGLAVELVSDTQAKRNPWVLIDCGEGTQYQLMNTPLKTAELQAILITHLHGDHCYGLAGLLASMAMHNRGDVLYLIAPKALIKLLDAYTLVSELQFNYPIEFMAIEEHLDKPITLSIKGQTLSIDITALSHRMPSYAFGLTYTINKTKLDIPALERLGIAKSEYKAYAKAHPEVVVDKTTSTRVVIAGDNDTPKLLSQAVKGATALVHEATYTRDVLDKILSKGHFNPMHSTAYQVATFAQESQVPVLILTHFSARYALFENSRDTTPNMGHIRAEACQAYQGELILAEDLMQIEID